MTRFILDTGIAGLYLDRKRGVFERAAVEVAKGNRVGIAVPVLGELAFARRGAQNEIGTFCAFGKPWTFGNCGLGTPTRRSSTRPNCL